jgi:OCRE domain
MLHSTSLGLSKCKTWNYPQEFRCARCGARSELSSSSRIDDYHRGDGFARNEGTEDAATKGSVSEDGQNRSGSEDGFVGGEEEQFDEFGRSLKLKEPRPFKKKREWPPSFDEEGSAFVFDSRCAMFYESESDFFYDPKSKLYYGNKQGLYFHYKPESKSFEPVSEISSQGSAADPEPILASSTSGGAGGKSEKKSISITIKTKVLKKNDNPDPSTAKISPAEGVEEPVRKKHAMDIEKWTARTQELKANDRAAPVARNSTASTTTTATQPTAAAAAAAVVRSVPSDDAVPRTPKGEPICMLCRRKFPTLEKLKYHEDVSQLHKDNLAKQASKIKSVDGPPTARLDSHAPAPQNVAPPTLSEPVASTEYVDRAQQRRNLFGPELGTLPVAASAPVPPPLTDAAGAHAPAARSAAPEAAMLLHPSADHDPLGASSVGRQLLQKLGWTGGAALLPGSKGSRSEAEQRRQEQMHANLQREWDRSSAPSAAAPGHR